MASYQKHSPLPLREGMSPWTGHELLSLAQKKDFIDLLAVKGKTINEPKDDITKLIKAPSKTVSLVRKFPLESTAVLADIEESSQETIAATMKGVKFFKSCDQIPLFSSNSDRGKIRTHGAKLLNKVVEFTRPPDPSLFIESSIVQEATGKCP